MNSGNIVSLLQQHGITGNVVLDGMILTSVIPILFTYLRIFTTGIYTTIKAVTISLLEIFHIYFKNKFFKQKLYSIVIKKNDEMYDLFKEHIFDNNIESDTIKKTYFEKIYRFVIMSIYPVKIFQLYRRNNEVANISLNYDIDSNNKFIHRPAGIQKTNKEIKYFIYDNYILKISLGKKTTSEYMTYSSPDSQTYYDIIIKLYRTKDDGKDNYPEIFANILEKRIKISNFVKYNYNLEIDGFHNNIANFIKIVNTPDSVDYKIYDNVKCDASTNMIVKNNYFHMSVTASNLKNKKKYSSDYILHKLLINSDNDNTHKIESYDNYHKKYVNINKTSNSQYGGNQYYANTEITKCYFWHNKELFLIENKLSSQTYNNHKSYTKVDIITPHKLSTDDLNDHIDWLLNKISTHTKYNLYASNDGKINVNQYQNGKWKQTIIPKRGMDTIYLPIHTKKYIIKEIEDFIEKKKIYDQYEIPYKKGFLFYGPPGTGKTSLVKAIASSYNIDIYTININDKEINDDTIVQIINDIGGDGVKILLFEDIDSAFSEKEKIKCEDKTIEKEEPAYYDINNKTRGVSSEKENDYGQSMMNSNMRNGNQNRVENKYLTYSGLLNALDGVLSNQTGVITIMTTNYIDKLGQALIRPGRIDNKFELKECDSHQIISMVKNYIDKYINTQKSDFDIDNYLPTDYNEKLDNFTKLLLNNKEHSHIKPCILQYHILRYINNPQHIFDNIHELMEVENIEP